MANIFSSSIGKKLIMSITGLFLVVFMLLHVSINLAILISEDAYNAACEFMDTNIFIQIMVPILAAGFFVHILYALILTLKNRKARPVKYAVNNKGEASSFASRNMFVLGLIIVGFLVLHLVQFWAKMQLAHYVTGHGHENPYLLVTTVLSNPLWAAIYLVCFGVLWFHLTHGFWSALQTVGFNNTKWLKRWQCIAKIYATVVCLGFAVVPVYLLVQRYILA
ncbi:MAG: succinate dehydrogenase cytochrome b subunit [Prevotellaceae bacterium]|jgi:succinate dehydrogenase / fumarate reductase cytochrome b subunit|nr:succinate dehydrogenase cytochrome b subunit [Prevotellaceae bacterium]